MVVLQIIWGTPASLLALPLSTPLKFIKLIQNFESPLFFNSFPLAWSEVTCHRGRRHLLA